jgi:hypothetical protein
MIIVSTKEYVSSLDAISIRQLLHMLCNNMCTYGLA